MARLVPGCAADGPRDFREQVLPSLLKSGLRVLDVGGGKHPAISLQTKRELGLHIVGLDVSQTELAQAPAGAYDAIVVGDAAAVEIPGQYDLVFSRSVFEHVENPRDAFANLARVLAPGGMMTHVVPCRNAPFAIANRWLGNQRPADCSSRFSRRRKRTVASRHTIASARLLVFGECAVRATWKS